MANPTVPLPTNHQFRNLTGQTFDRLTVLRFERMASGASGWRCVCSCGQITVVRSDHIIQGRIRSCGCLLREIVSARMTTHGQTRRYQKRPAEYVVWEKMKGRCRPHSKGSEHYGQRGIAVCERWLNSYENFIADMGPRPSPKHQIERKDNDGPYSPDNCRWATRLEQCRNRRSNVWLTFNGETMCAKDWSDRLGLEYSTLRRRITSGWSDERALTTPVRKLPRR